MTSANELLERIKEKNDHLICSKPSMAHLIDGNHKIRNATDESVALQLIMSTLILNLDERLKQMEKSLSNQNKMPQKTLTSAQAQPNPEIKRLQRQNEEFEGKVKLQIEKLNVLEASLKGIDDKLESYNVRFSHKLESINDNLSFACRSEVTKFENDLNKKLGLLVGDLKKTFEDLKGRMEIEGEVRYNDNRFDLFSQKLQEDFEKLNIQVKNDLALHKSDFNKEKEFLRESQKALKPTLSAQQNPANSTISKLEKQIDDLNKKVLTLELSENFQATKLMIESVQHENEDLKTKFIESVEAINTTIIPFIIGTHRATQTLNQRIDSFWKSRDKNKYLRGEEQRGFGINTEIVKQELQNQYQEYKNKKFRLVQVNDQIEEERCRLNLNTFTEPKSSHISKQCFREDPAFYYTDRGDKVVLYIPKDIGNKVLQPQNEKHGQTESLSQTSIGRDKEYNRITGAYSGAPRNSF